MPAEKLLDALLDSWDRNNAILVNLLRILPDGAMEARAMEDSPSVAEMFMHIYYVRLSSFQRTRPNSPVPCPKANGKRSATATASRNGSTKAPKRCATP